MSFFGFFSIGEAKKSDYENGLKYTDELLKIYKKNVVASYNVVTVFDLAKVFNESSSDFINTIGYYCRVVDFDDSIILEAFEALSTKPDPTLKDFNFYLQNRALPSEPVSYTHLTLPTNREV